MTSRLLPAALAALLLSGCAALHREDARPTLAPTVCATRDFNVYFEGQSIELSPEAKEAIDANSNALAGCTIDHVRIVGSSDAIGAESENEVVAKQRALVMADYLVEHAKWSRESMEMLATGERGATTEQGLQVPMRRRAHITVNASPPK